MLSVELEPSFSVIREDYNTRFSIGRKFAEVRCQTKCSMIDGKMVSLLQGDSGAFCHLFHNTRADCNSNLMIAEGFNINKDYATCQEAWEKLVSGEIQYCSSERRGQCHESIVKTDLYCFSVLHFKLRSLDFAQKILYHLVGGQKIWSETANLHVMRFLTRAKKECIESIKSSTGMLIDSPSSSGGNTNTGPLADKFFGPLYRDKICSVILNEEDHLNYADFMSDLYHANHYTVCRC